MKKTKPAFRHLGAAEQVLMDYLWTHGPVTAESCRENWSGKPITDSTVRTMLRRMEAKGYITHTVEGKAFVYRALEQRESVALRALKQLLDRFCGGSTEALLAGMVRHKVIDRKELAHIAKRLSAEKGEKGKP